MTIITPSSARDKILGRFAAVFALLVSLAGIVLGWYLTILKFTAWYTPCLSALGGCKVIGLTCSDALNSSMSTLFGLPVSLWATAFYLSTAMLAGGLAWRREFLRGAAIPLLFGLALFGACVSCLYAVTAILLLDVVCPFCLLLYAVSALLVINAALVRRSQPHAPIWPLRRRAALLDAGFQVALVFLLSAGIQSLVFQQWRQSVDAQDGCPEPLMSLPDAAIKTGVADPKVILAMFMDMSCVHCKSEYVAVADALASGLFAEPTQIWIFHTPRQACDADAFPTGYAKSHDSARADNPCLAARAAECTEKLLPGTGFAMIGGLLALLDSREADVPLFTAERVGNQAVDLGMRIDPDDETNALYRCINEDKTILARITAHQRHAEGPKYQIPTIAVYAATAGEPDLSRKPMYAWGNTSISTLAEYITTQAQPLID